MSSRKLEQRVDDLEDAVARISPKLVPDLSDLLACYPGGHAALSEASGYHRETIYAFSNAKRTSKFPLKRAAAIARAFGTRRALGRRVTIELLRQSWLDKRQSHQSN